MAGERTLMSEMRLINIALRRNMSRGCEKGHKVPAVSDMVLHYIFMRGGSALQKDVENEFDLRRSSASQLLGKLESDGQITRAVSESDGRSKRIYLTEKALGEQEKTLAKFRATEAYVDSALSSDEKEVFFALCDKIRRLLESERLP